MSFRNPAVEQALAAFCARHIYLRCEWVEAAVEFVQRRQKSSFELLQHVYFEWLHTNLLHTTAPTFQEPLGAFSNQRVVLQIVSMTDISNGRARNSKNGDLQIQTERRSSAVTDPVYVPHTRMLKLVLSDGSRTTTAIEHQPMRELDGARPGCKIFLCANIPFKNGTLLLTSANCQVLGGEVAELGAGMPRAEAPVASQRPMPPAPPLPPPAPLPQAPPPRQLPTAPPPQAPALPTFPTVPVILPPALPKPPPVVRPTAPSIRPAAPRVRPTVPSVQPAPAATQWPTASAAPTAVRMNAPSTRPVVPSVRPPPASSQWVGATALSLVPKAPRARTTAATTQRPAAPLQPSNPPPADGGVTQAPTRKLEQTSIKSFMTQKRRSPMAAAVQQPPAAKRAHFSIVSPPKPSGTFAKTQALPDVRPTAAEATRSAATGRSAAPTSGRSAAAAAAEGGSQGGSRRPPMSERDFSQLLQLNTRRLVIPHAAAREFWGLLARSAGALQPNETLESVQSILPSSIFFLRYFPFMQQELPKYERAMRALRTINTRLQLEIKTGRNIYDRPVDPFLNQVDNFLSKVRLFIDSARRCGFGPQDLRVELAVRLKSEIIPQLTVRMLREQLGLKALDENAGILQKYTVQLSGICVLVGVVS